LMRMQADNLSLIEPPLSPHPRQYLSRHPTLWFPVP
jgi:hypothetical protein